MAQDTFLKEVEADLINRPQISQTVIDVFTEFVDRQDGKGWKKYGETIDEAADEDYDWNLMALEEAVDLMKYMVKENVRLQSENTRLKKDLERSKQT